MDNQFIVAEVSKTWLDGEGVPGTPVDCLAMKFEDVINTNSQRGYDLVDWKLHTSQGLVSVGVNRQVANYVETIIAIFKLREGK